MTRGVGGVSQKVIFGDEGGRGVQTPPKNDDIIYEQPLVCGVHSRVSTVQYICWPDAINNTKRRNQAVPQVPHCTVHYSALKSTHQCTAQYTTVQCRVHKNAQHSTKQSNAEYTAVHITVHSRKLHSTQLCTAQYTTQKSPAQYTMVHSK